MKNENKFILLLDLSALCAAYGAEKKQNIFTVIIHRDQGMDSNDTLQNFKGDKFEFENGTNRNQFELLPEISYNMYLSM